MPLISASEIETCRAIYFDILNVDQQGNALTVDSLQIINILGQVSQTLKLDLYDLIDDFQGEHFESCASFLAHLEKVAAELRTP